MNKKIIAVDIDEVLAANAPSFIKYTNNKWNMNLSVDDYHEHWAELWKTDHEETLRRAKQYNFSGAIESMSHFEDAKRVLNKLAHSFELVIITARRKELSQATQQWIEKHYPETFWNIYHAGIWDTEHVDAVTHTKADVCAEIGVSYLIDDQSKHCNAAQAAGVQAIMFGDYPWNRSDELFKGVVRCVDWDKVLEYFDGQN